MEIQLLQWWTSNKYRAPRRSCQLPSRQLSRSSLTQRIDFANCFKRLLSSRDRDQRDEEASLFDFTASFCEPDPRVWEVLFRFGIAPWRPCRVASFMVIIMLMFRSIEMDTITCAHLALKMKKTWNLELEWWSKMNKDTAVICDSLMLYTRKES
jgi:hypothetical protein